MSYEQLKPAYAKDLPINLTPKQIELVRYNLSLVASTETEAFKNQTEYTDPLILLSQIFYGKLFEIIPEARVLFKKDLKVQGGMLTKTIALSVKMLDDVEQLAAALDRLAVRHIRYGSTIAQYGAVGEALLYALGRVSGDAFTADVTDAWVTVYSLMLSVMIPAQLRAEEAAKASGATTPLGASTSAPAATTAAV